MKVLNENWKIEYNAEIACIQDILVQNTPTTKEINFLLLEQLIGNLMKIIRMK